MTTSAAPVRAASSASAGSRSPLTSLSITAPASSAARATSGFQVSTETLDALGREALDERDDARGLLVGRRRRACR